MWNELEVPDPRYARLSAGQRALFALQWPDWEILDGGFDQFWYNDAGWFADELAADARRVGASARRTTSVSSATQRRCSPEATFPPTDPLGSGSSTVSRIRGSRRWTIATPSSSAAGGQH